jgi:LysM repeat protein
MIRRWNGLRGNGLNGRTVLALHLPVAPGAEVAVSAASHSRKSTQTASAGKLESATRKNQNQANEETEQASVLRHTVKSGETLYSIATTYKTTVAALERNNHNVATLRPGMILIVQSTR